jgi:hypothetical protein
VAISKFENNFSFFRSRNISILDGVFEREGRGVKREKRKEKREKRKEEREKRKEERGKRKEKSDLLLVSTFNFQVKNLPNLLNLRAKKIIN